MESSNNSCEKSRLLVKGIELSLIIKRLNINHLFLALQYYEIDWDSFSLFSQEKTRFRVF